MSRRSRFVFRGVSAASRVCRFVVGGGFSYVRGERCGFGVRYSFRGRGSGRLRGWGFFFKGLGLVRLDGVFYLGGFLELIRKVRTFDFRLRFSFVRLEFLGMGLRSEFFVTFYRRF